MTPEMRTNTIRRKDVNGSKVQVARSEVHVTISKVHVTGNKIRVSRNGGTASNSSVHNTLEIWSMSPKARGSCH